jgi:transcriptional/translational regulatory protein YebC/TACO1
VRYEGYGPGDSALLIDCLTPDPARTAAELRELLEAHGGYLGARGSVAYLFNEVGLLAFPPGTRREPLLGLALEAGAEDVIVNEDGSLEVLTDPPDLAAVDASLSRTGFIAADTAVTQRASSRVELSGTAASEMVALLAALTNLAEVQSVYTNAEVSDEVLARI